MSRQNNRSRVMKKKRRKNLAGIAIVVMLLCSVVAYKRIDLNERAAEGQKKLNDLEKIKEAELERTDEIADYKAYVESKQYIEQEARDKLGLVYPDEIVFEAEED